MADNGQSDEYTFRRDFPVLAAQVRRMSGTGCTSRRECDGKPCWLTAGHRGLHECHPFHRCPEHGRVWA